MKARKKNTSRMKTRAKNITLSLLTLFLALVMMGCTSEVTPSSIVEEGEMTTFLEEREMEIETQSIGDETWINASNDTMTLHYWVNEEDNYYIEQSRESSLRMAQDMDGEIIESNGFTEIIIDWSIVGQDFHSVHWYGENKRVHIRLYDLNELDEIRNLILQ